MKPRKQFVLQFRTDRWSSISDFDRVVEIEEKLDAALRRNESGYVDGHDVGGGTMNLFIIVKTWKQGTWFLEQYLKNQPWAVETVLAKDNRDGTFEVIWPSGFGGTFHLM